jgi:hypothetical protein
LPADCLLESVIFNARSGSHDSFMWFEAPSNIREPKAVSSSWSLFHKQLLQVAGLILKCSSIFSITSQRDGRQVQYCNLRR